MSKDSVSEPAGRLAGELFELSIALDLVGNAAAGRIGINQTDLICLTLLVRHGPMSSGQIASALGLTAAAISAMAARLEAGGYARREIDPKDRRRILLYPSESGAQRAFGLFDDLYQAMAGLLADYPERDLERFAGLLTRFRELLTAQAAAIAEHGKAP